MYLIKKRNSTRYFLKISLKRMFSEGSWLAFNKKRAQNWAFLIY
jgi:hypothetical protein